ncbi:hypothetical protein H6P81_003234 [Aristolochia fimbriata]|uniref:Pectinesterase n=1 Tax=Aristolochia fimbriata TaxID=158543 RepID=A0AAV7FF77_ARIFI|nr:hypothetical protein H6P81_003234 [Aristolochia fimbriata]
MQSLFILFLINIFLHFSSANAECTLFELEKFGRHSGVMNVDGNGDTGFASIAEAILSVPHKNHRWTFIKLQPGTYREKVVVPKDKRCIILLGSGVDSTIITANVGAGNLRNATFSVLADYFVASGITFQNEYNVALPDQITNPVVKQAVAMEIFGDKSSFHNCSFVGYQDTLWDAKGRHYFKECKISGAIDFIFGQGQSLYEGCVIEVNSEINRTRPGYLTAQGREGANDTNGFVFKNCSIEGYQTAYLGRAWRPYSRVLFFESYLSEVVAPEGWLAWAQANHTELITFAERGNYGPGSFMDRRVEWEKNLTDSEITAMTCRSFVDEDGWVEFQELLLQWPFGALS